MTKKTSFDSILVANRGEIACRVMRTAKRLGLRTIAVYSDADVNALHVRMADDAVHIGPSPAAQSYLDAKRIVAAALTSGAGAIHPGYGFLSENAEFARAVTKAGLVFIGPSSSAIEIMGDKARAKRHLADAQVPCIPGYQGEDQSDECFIRAAEQIGFPVMVKAAAGGGGRGMRLVVAPEQLLGALALARSEAKSAFGSDILILERALLSPRHVEVQVFADAFGKVVHLGERDCSVQRRHQKVIEEAPCPVMTPELRARMGAAACATAAAVEYCGAGTVEFLLAADGEFYFLEMNTRLQVEHPVTEMVTGIDLVEAQLRVASGERLAFEQHDVSFTGHAIEVRLCAEDPAQDFLPSTGPVLSWITPSLEGVRVDHGLASGGEVSAFYDSMVAKVIAHGATREQARQRLSAALRQTALLGPHSNRDFLIQALDAPAFVAGAATTAFIAEHFGATGLIPEPMSAPEVAVAATLFHAHVRQRMLADAISVSHELLDWSSAGAPTTYLQFALGDASTEVVVRSLGQQCYEVEASGATVPVQIRALEEQRALISVDGRAHRVLFVFATPRVLHLTIDARTHAAINTAGAPSTAESAAGGGAVVAPMHGQLLQVLVATGERVEKGQCVAILEAMKMQHELVAEIDGNVAELCFESGAQITSGVIILSISPDAN
jgi:geranyl-CoA carboxylase alpha subunit